MNNYSFNELLELAKDDKNTDAQFTLGNLYFYGSPEVKRDLDEGVFWYIISAENGEINAMKTLYEIYYKGIYIEKDIELANIYKKRIQLTEKEFSETLEDIFLDMGDLKEKHLNIDFYQPELSKSFNLSDELTHEYFRKYKKGYSYMREILLVSNLKLISKILFKRISFSNPFYWDYFQEGVIGLLNCIEGFDIEKGYRFSTYSYMSIKRFIDRAVQENVHIVHKPAYVFENYGKINRLRKELNSSSHCETMKFVCENLSISEKKYINTIAAIEENVIGLEFEDDGGGTEERFSDFSTPESIFLEKESLIEVIKTIDKALPKPLWREVIKRRNGIFPYTEIETLEEIARKNSGKKVTRERVRQIEKKSLDKLRAYILREELEEYLNTKNKKVKETLKNKPTYISNTLFLGDEKMIITDPIELIKTKLIKVKKNYDLNPYEALAICKEAIGMQNLNKTILTLEEEKEIYELVVKLLNHTGKLNELSPYYSKLQALESLLVPEDEYQKLIEEFDEAKEKRDNEKIHKLANKILSSFSGKVPKEKEKEIEDVYTELVDHYYNKEKYDDMIMTVDEYLENFEANNVEFEEMVNLVLDEKIKVIVNVFNNLLNEEKYNRIIQIGDIIHKRIEKNEELSNEDKESFYINYADYFEKIEKDKASAIFYYREATNYSSDASYIAKQIFELKKTEVVEKYNEKLPHSAMKDLLKDAEKLIEESQEYESIKINEILDIKFELLKALDKVEELSKFLLENPNYADNYINETEEVYELEEIIYPYINEEYLQDIGLFNNEAVKNNFMFLEKLIYLKNPQGDFENKLSESMKKIFREQNLYPNQIHKLDSELSYVLQQWNKDENRDKFGFLYKQFIELAEILREHKAITSYGALKKLLETKKNIEIEELGEEQISMEKKDCVYNFEFLTKLPNTIEQKDYDEIFLKENRLLIEEYGDRINFIFFKITLKKLNGILQGMKKVNTLKLSSNFLFEKIIEDNIDNFNDLDNCISKYSGKNMETSLENIEECFEIEEIEFDNDLIYKNNSIFFQKSFRIISPENEETEIINEALKEVYKTYINLESFGSFINSLEYLKDLAEHIPELDFLTGNTIEILELIVEQNIDSYKQLDMRLKVTEENEIEPEFNNSSIYDKVTNFYKHQYYIANNREQWAVMLNQSLKAVYDSYMRRADYQFFTKTLQKLQKEVDELGKFESLLEYINLVLNEIENFTIKNFNMLDSYCNKIQNL